MSLKMQVKETGLEVWQSWKDNNNLDKIHRMEEKCDSDSIWGDMLERGGKDGPIINRIFIYKLYSTTQIY